MGDKLHKKGCHLVLREDDKIDSPQIGLLTARLVNIHFYSYFAPSSLDIIDFSDYLDKLVKNAKDYLLVVIAGDFNAWVVLWSSNTTNMRGNELLHVMSFFDMSLFKPVNLKINEEAEQN